ncbi:outer membrane beta-barrel protein [Devosia neptuniae]|uniref:Outer membrane beta-barrel protein n=1 Tax=Devosia neptuniae TaxID=191302 RepID=A0ABY6CHI9_9HYPH|nr:outer membrane beta-barrel protein [Devosia neptuniae]UXN71669.1 outer membrane beta-barrel protein [Devosia neptuniae]
MRSAILLVGASFSLLASSAQAQDITDWSGFYAGVLVGYGMDRTQTESSSSIIPPVEAGDDVFYSGSNRFSQERIEGLLGGVGAGYNFQHNQFVLGVDGDINFGDLDKTTSAFGSLTIDDREDGEVFELGQGSDTTYGVDWYSTFALRAGVTFDGWLVYAKMGAAVGNVSSNSTSNFTVASNLPPEDMPLPAGSYSSSANTSQLLFGPTFGLGVEKMLTSNISLGAEYSYVGLPDVTIPQASGIGGDLLGIGGGSDPIEVTSSIHVLKGTLKYHF